MTPKPITRSIGRREVLAYLRKAEEHAAAACECLQHERFDSAASMAAHAGINAADAITGVESNQRSVGTDHSMAVALLRTRPMGKTVAQHLVRLLQIKPKAEYDFNPVTRREAVLAFRSAEKLLAAARKIVEPKH